MLTSSRAPRAPSVVQLIEPPCLSNRCRDEVGPCSANPRRVQSSVVEEASRAEVRHREAMLSMHEELREMNDTESMIAKELRDIERCRQDIQRKKEERSRRAAAIRAATLHASGTQL